MNEEAKDGIRKLIESLGRDVGAPFLEKHIWANRAELRALDRSMIAYVEKYLADAINADQIWPDNDAPMIFLDVPPPKSSDGLVPWTITSSGQDQGKFRAPIDWNIARYHATAVGFWIRQAPTLNARDARTCLDYYGIEVEFCELGIAGCAGCLKDARNAIVAHLRSAKLWEPEAWLAARSK